MTRRWWALVIVLAWTAVALVSASRWYLFRLSAGLPHSVGEALARSLPSCWFWAALTPAIVWLARRFRLERGGWRRALALHGLFSLGFALVDAIASLTLLAPLSPEPPASLVRAFIGGSFINIFSYFAVVAAAHAVDYHNLSVERELTASHLRTELLGARLRALEMQLHPHFLFNTLHTIASLVRVNRNPAAVQMIAGLSDLLRGALRADQAPEVPLRDELAFVERYLAIERIRFEDRLETRVTADPGVLDALVPALILLPLVENAIRHGIERRLRPGSVEVEAARRNGDLVLRVQDSGSGPSPAAPVPDGAGIGLTNTRTRLRHLYGDRHRLALTPTADGGAVAVVELPLHTEPLAT